MTKYIVLKLTSGQEIIGKETQIWNDLETETRIRIEEPFEIKSQWTPQGEFQMALIPFLPYLKNNIVLIEHASVSCVGHPADAMLKEYTKVTSGIVLP